MLDAQMTAEARLCEAERASLLVCVRHDARPDAVRELAVRACFARVRQAERDRRRAIGRGLWRMDPVSGIAPEMRWLGAAVLGVSLWLLLV